MKPGELGRKLALLRAEHDLRQIEVVRFVKPLVACSSRVAPAIKV